MKSKYFVISESAKDPHPIKVEFNEDKISFKIENCGRVVSEDKKLQCPKCGGKYKGERKRCGNCRVNLKVVDGKKLSYPKEIKDSLSILKKVFINNNFNGFDEKKFIKAMSFIEKEKADKLYSLSIKNILISTIVFNNKIKKLEKSIKDLKSNIENVEDKIDDTPRIFSPREKKWHRRDDWDDDNDYY